MQSALDKQNPEKVTGNVGFEELAIALVAGQFNPTSPKVYINPKSWAKFSHVHVFS
jgi:hypothetical protein